MITYKRLFYAKLCLNALIDKLESHNDLALHIADNDSGGDHVQTLIDIAKKSNRFSNVTSTVAVGGGYGHNFNTAMQAIHRGDLVLPLEDDWKLVRDFNIDPIAQAVLKEDGCVRLGYLGVLQGITGRIRKIEGDIYFEFDPKSPDQYVFTGHPRLETVAFEKRVGVWPEIFPAGDVELTVAGRPEARKNVFWPMQYIKPSGDLFVHIGTDKA
jgi:hypothetical protein